MKIIDVVNNIKKYHRGIGFDGKPIDEAKTRDKILYGNPEVECSGIVTTCWASVDVINEAVNLGANLIICHEALFWNRGDHYDWLIEEGNQTFLAKQELLDKHGIVVWRNHDYIHSGIPLNGGWTDGIFYGVAKILGWQKFIVEKEKPMLYQIPATPLKDVVELFKEKLDLQTIRILGNENTMVKRVAIGGHIQGGDNALITRVDKEEIDLVISLELIDYTFSEYVRDSGMLGRNKAIMALGHFNAEEPGMEYMVNWLDEAIGEHIEATYVKSGDMFRYL